MQLDEVLEHLRAERGAVRVELLPDDLCDTVVREEATVTAVDGMLPVKNTGLDDFLTRNTKLVVFDDGTLFIPDCSTMEMVNGKGEVFGHDIRLCDAPEYRGRDDVMFISDDFVMFTDRDMDGESYMNIKSAPFYGTDNWVPRDSDCVIWFSSSTSSDIIHDYFGQEKTTLATAFIGLNL